MSFSLDGRVAVVFGVANKRSIAWSIAQGLHQAGARLAITYQNERLEQEARDLILSLPGTEAFMCDVSRDEDVRAALDKTIDSIRAQFGAGSLQRGGGMRARSAAEEDASGLQ